MINIIYPVIESEWEELKFSLRSLDKHLKTDYRVILYATYIPEWITNVDIIFTPRAHSPNFPHTQYNQGLIFQRIIKSAIKEFVFFNDDIYLLEDQTNLDNVYHVAHDQPKENLSKNRWNQRLWCTRDSLTKQGLPNVNYETHLPYTIETSKLATLDKVLTGEHLLATSYYNKYYPGETTNCNTVKSGLYRKQSKYVKRRWFNHSDEGLDTAKEILPKLFPNKSRFEK